MAQTKERQREYFIERRLLKGDEMRAKGAEWRERNRDYLKEKGRQRRLQNRAKCLVAGARVRARNRNIPFDVSPNEVDRLQSIIDAGKCEITGTALILSGPRSPASPSLDRITPARGYVDGNLRIVCHAINAAMGDWGEQALLEIIAPWILRVRDERDQ